MAASSAIVGLEGALELPGTPLGSSIRESIRSYLGTQPPQQQLSLLLEIIGQGASHHDGALGIIAEAWDHLCAHQLWRAAPDQRYASLEGLRLELDTLYDLTDKLQAHRKLQLRKKRELDAIEAQWGAPLAQLVPATLLPADPGWVLMQKLGQLSRRLDSEQACAALQKAIDQRIQSPGRRKNPQLSVADVTDVLQRVSGTAPTGPAMVLRSSQVPNVRSQVNEEGTLPDGASDAPDGAGSEPAGALSTPAAAADASAETAHACACPQAFSDAWKKRFPVAATDDERAKALLDQAHACGLARLCRLHLRALSALLGLKNSISNARLIHRLGDIRSCELVGLQALRRRRWAWFRQQQRPSIPQDELIIYRFPHRAPAHFAFEASAVLERFAGEGAWQTWLDRGTLTLPDFFAHLDNPQVRRQWEQEFALYRHHQWVPSGKKRMGWMRHMFYSGIQQLLRMDPAWYAVTAATRPDQQWRLLARPYIAKDTDPGESTGFLHLDLNVGRYIQDGSGGNLLSSSISLDDETPNGCTVVVPGFHKHIRAWHERVEARSQRADGATTNCSNTYRPEDQERWGPPEPQPCPALGLRLTLPTLIHGSTPRSTARRRTLFAWYTGIAEDHETLYDARDMTWSEVAACHRDLRIPPREPAGSAPLHRVPDWVFPASVVLDRVSPLAAALVGARRWTDPAVLRERDVLLGPDDRSARALVASVRRQLVQAYLRYWPDLIAAETAAYGENSYFDGGVPSEEADASSSGLSSPPSDEEPAASQTEDV